MRMTATCSAHHRHSFGVPVSCSGAYLGSLVSKCHTNTSCLWAGLRLLTSYPSWAMLSLLHLLKQVSLTQ